MGQIDRSRFPYTWEQAIEKLRQDPAHQYLIFDSYLGADLADNSRRFFASTEFAETLALLRAQAPAARDLLDIPGGNGIAAHAFAKAGFAVTTVEPDPSPTVGRGAIAAVLKAGGVEARIVDSYGESLPFDGASFDIVYVRQGLHHAADLPRMLSEYGRVLRPGGVLMAAREHVVDDYGPSLEAFLATQADHQLYGGEHAFTLADYRAAMQMAGLIHVLELGPVDSNINLHPASIGDVITAMRASRKGRILYALLSDALATRIGLWWMRRQRAPGRLYTFLARKPAKAD
jgi:ubiquinone/menaquinone biosynthesis C-methylase UbiE